MYKYGIDGKLRLESHSETLDRESIRGGRSHLTKEEEMQRAKSSLIGVRQMDNPFLPNEKSRDNELPWSRSVDRILFSRDGEADFDRKDPRFIEFKEFYVKFKTLSAQKKPNPTANEEIELAR